MINQITDWLDSILSKNISFDVVAFCFNLYEDGDSNWSMELVGTGTFDEEDEDWVCDEVGDFGTREKPLTWVKVASWEEILEDVKGGIREYLNNGKYAGVLKSKAAVGVGFVDGDVSLM